MRTALTGLLSVSEIQADNLPDHHEHKEHFVLMRDASRDLHAFCETVLETASLDHPSDLEAPTPFSLETLITHKVDLFKPAMLHKGLTCSVKALSDSLPPLLGHPLLLERVLINLMGNAIKFTEIGGITLQYGLSDLPSENAMTHQLTLIVSDTGQGIPEDKQAIIFDSFTRLTPTYQGLHKGQGLGLYITQKLLHQMGGTITVASDGLGTGTTFRCQIPVLLSSEPIEASVADIDKPYRVLIADDSKMARFAAAMLIKDVLKNATVEQASTLSEIIQKTDHTAYDLLILDLSFPDGDARTVVDHVRNAPEAKNVETPIVALTGRLDTTLYQACLQAGMNTVIRKPLTLPMIQGFVDNLLVD
ncbi:MAG: response regulator [Gammaproteobacteria bacterium]|nr:response regulator [Gammaproteobacteria bacterium]